MLLCGLLQVSSVHRLSLSISGLPQTWALSRVSLLKNLLWRALHTTLPARELQSCPPVGPALSGGGLSVVGGDINFFGCWASCDDPPRGNRRRQRPCLRPRSSIRKIPTSSMPPHFPGKQADTFVFPLSSLPLQRSPHSPTLSALFFSCIFQCRKLRRERERERERESVCRAGFLR